MSFVKNECKKKEEYALEQHHVGFAVVPSQLVVHPIPFSLGNEISLVSR